MAMNTKDSGGEDDVMGEINVTPLVDVMLVLLVVFIVTAPLLTQAVHVNLPKTAETAPPEEKEAVYISVDAKGKVFIDKTEIALEAFESELLTRKAADPEIALNLNADDAVQYGTVAKVMSSIERSGITKLSVLTIPGK
ncbi:MULTISPECIES: ExbD/TolR family protein [Methylobacter]|jgi:outer membrane transport energization protein ExbD (TC 2.C.1.1.1)|uniref:Biopolymer transport protein ExbD/TolR n=2 Tax=Methylobacter tundripaludum TaxID=173365 RepID=G3IXJ0_METTV|nr:MULTISPECIES: biopolymer transporter ExbD [Methylobacter]EGW23399.1 Biopolymer transport protein ExbD/TolR [Methylobacter tundripaludum SV96]MDI1277572.1 biopolymer transporter ExbD [Methylobacter sp.]MDI1358137.1 biopolymer transporter ExbD [Methylobacter sp.]PPK78055.1 outer membrane transport energization protein ExbD [Methylobacter tundripaludum]